MDFRYGGNGRDQHYCRAFAGPTKVQERIRLAHAAFFRRLQEGNKA